MGWICSGWMMDFRWSIQKWIGLVTKIEQFLVDVGFVKAIQKYIELKVVTDWHIQFVKTGGSEPLTRPRRNVVPEKMRRTLKRKDSLTITIFRWYVISCIFEGYKEIERTFGNGSVFFMQWFCTVHFEFSLYLFGQQCSSFHEYSGRKSKPSHMGIVINHHKDPY